MVNSLRLDNGLINAKGCVSQTITVDSLSGNGTVNLSSATDGNKIEAASLSVKQADSTAGVNVNYAGITADDITDVNKALKSVEGNVTGVAHTNNIAEGEVNGAISQTVDATGTVGAITRPPTPRLTPTAPC